MIIDDSFEIAAEVALLRPIKERVGCPPRRQGLMQKTRNNTMVKHQLMEGTRIGLLNELYSSPVI
jgi:hypothetical protein